METSANLATPTRRPAPGGISSTPNAKRPTSIQLDLTPDGPLMDQATMSAAIYEIQRRLAPMESWSTTVQDALGNHAGHIDQARANIESMLAFAIKSEEQAGKAERDQIRADLVMACERVNANDAAIKRF